MGRPVQMLEGTQWTGDSRSGTARCREREVSSDSSVVTSRQSQRAGAAVSGAGLGHWSEEWDWGVDVGCVRCVVGGR